MIFNFNFNFNFNFTFTQIQIQVQDLAWLLPGPDLALWGPWAQLQVGAQSPKIHNLIDMIIAAAKYEILRKRGAPLPLAQML